MAYVDASFQNARWGYRIVMVHFGGSINLDKLVDKKNDDTL